MSTQAVVFWLIVCLHVLKAKSLNCVQFFATPWTVAHQAPLSLGFSRQEYWSWLSFPSPGDLPNPGIERTSPELAGRFFTTDPNYMFLVVKRKKPIKECCNFKISRKKSV